MNVTTSKQSHSRNILSQMNKFREAAKTGDVKGAPSPFRPETPIDDALSRVNTLDRLIREAEHDYDSSKSLNAPDDLSSSQLANRFQEASVKNKDLAEKVIKNTPKTEDRAEYVKSAGIQNSYRAMALVAGSAFVAVAGLIAGAPLAAATLPAAAGLLFSVAGLVANSEGREAANGHLKSQDEKVSYHQSQVKTLDQAAMDVQGWALLS